MRRTILIILSFTILLTAIAADAQRQRRAKSSRTPAKRTAVSKPKPKVNTDSIEAVRQLQLRIDSLNNVTAKANEGDLNALNQLASWYYTGHLVNQDYKVAAELWRQAAELSDVRAMASLGLCYRLGHGVEQDSIEAARLYGKSIREGNGAVFKQCIDSAANDIFSAILIGNCYKMGDGVKRDISRAADFYAKAAVQGSVPAMREAGMCYLESGDTDSAFTYFEMGANSCDSVCQFWTGSIIIEDGGDINRAVSLIREAAEHGLPIAQNFMGTLYQSGTGVPVDPAQAAQWFRRAAENKSVKGMKNYANALANGEGVAVDFSAALALTAETFAAEKPDMYILMDKTLFDKYLDGMKLLLIDNDMAAANNIIKVLDKAKVPEAKIMQALMLASKANPKAKPKKAAKALTALAATDKQAAFYLAKINASGAPAAIDADKAVAEYYGSDDVLSLLRSMCKPNVDILEQ